VTGNGEGFDRMTKLRINSPDPILASDVDVQKAQAINVLLVRPIGILPVRPGDRILPFAIGLFHEIRALLKPEASVTGLRRAVSAFTHSKRYHMASAQPNSVRHAIDGTPQGPLTDEDRMTAKNHILALKQKTFVNQSMQSAASPCFPATEPFASSTMTRNEQIRAALLVRNRTQQTASISR
jgi:sRNA-binding protein